MIKERIGQPLNNQPPFRPASALLEHPAGIKWLRRFEPADQAELERMLNCMTLISWSYIERWLSETLSDCVKSRPTDAPIAVFTVRGLHQDERHTSKKGEANATRKQHYFDGHGDNALTKFRNDEIGSEHLLAYLARIAESQDSYILDHPTISQMKESKVREVILLDTVSYSGATVSNFLCLFHDNKTLKRWMSAGLIRYKVAICVGQRGIEDVIRANIQGSETQQREHKNQPSRSDPLTRRHTSKIDFLIDIHSPKLDMERFKPLLKRLRQHVALEDRSLCLLGYAQCMSSTIVAPRASNNIPAILWSGNDSLLPNRSIPVEFEPYFRDSVYTPISLLTRPTLPREMLTIFFLWSRGYRKIHSLTLASGLPRRTTTTLVEQAKRFGLILDAGKLSERAMLELKTHCKSSPHMAHLAQIPTIDKSVPYYKTS